MPKKSQPLVSPTIVSSVEHRREPPIVAESVSNHRRAFKNGCRANHDRQRVFKNCQRPSQAAERATIINRDSSGMDSNCLKLSIFKENKASLIA